jgi:dipeptidyl-peptidase-4
MLKQLFFLASLSMLVLTGLQAQSTKISLEDIWSKGTFRAEYVPGFTFQNDGKHYTRLERNKILQYDITTGEPTATIFDPTTVKANKEFKGRIDSYSFSADESRILIKTETEPIYRRSSRANYFVYDREAQTLTTVYPKAKQREVAFNPQANRVAFVVANNLYYKDLKTGQVQQITKDGKENEIINGATDWVYEEEFSFHRGFAWSEDGQRLAFFRFDEREVKEFTMTNYYDDLYPEYVTFKYPKVGEKNSDVTIHIFDVKSGKTIDAAVTQDEDYYIPRIKWLPDSDNLCVFRMNRHQNQLELLKVDARSGKSGLLFKEENKYYIDIHDNLTFLKDGQGFIWTSEMDGWNHIYHYDMDGKKVKQITKGNWEVTDFYGVDETNGKMYFQAAVNTPLEREVYEIGLNGKGQKALAKEPGYNSAQFSSTFDYYVLNYSNVNTPSSYTVYSRKGKKVRVIEDNAKLMERQDQFGVQDVEFFTFENSDGTDLNGWMIKPGNFTKNRKYPVLMYLYGGPGSQQVLNSWRGTNYWWFQMLAQQGYVVACVDNRGTGARGEEFKKMTYLDLGKLETADQIDAAKYVGSLPFADEQRIGIFGWSYGGYMSSLCLLKGNDVFSAAIAVAPVTNWKWYDTIYTERYMRTEKENPGGYRDNSPVYFADRLKGDYLLIHGMGDDNVHFQNTAEMANALIAANKQFDTYYYPNRNHGIYGGNTRLHLYTKMTNFLDDKLKGKAVKVPVKNKIKMVAPSQKLPAPLKE